MHNPRRYKDLCRGVELREEQRHLADDINEPVKNLHPSKEHVQRVLRMQPHELKTFMRDRTRYSDVFHFREPPKGYFEGDLTPARLERLDLLRPTGDRRPRWRG